MNIKQGMTFNGWSPYVGVVLLFMAIILLVGALLEDMMLLIPALSLGFFGVVIFMNLRGTVIDAHGKRCRLYRDLVLFKIGHWIPLTHFDRVTVTRYRERYSHSIGEYMGRTSNVKTFFVALRGERIDIHLKEVDSRSEAVELGRKVASLLSFRLDDRSAPPAAPINRRR